MHLVSTVTPENRISIGLRNDAHGEVERAELAVLSPLEVRAYVSQLLRVVEVAERRIRSAAAAAAAEAT